MITSKLSRFSRSRSILLFTRAALSAVGAKRNKEKKLKKKKKNNRYKEKIHRDKNYFLKNKKKSIK